ncbi:protein FAM204A isoform X2 [Osmerus eperlanus]|uniref:protein FAM204A isoform X2 n=1 Tax=Osmerus eperlanus TaxID=29151 RepID=UPI002E125EC4
MYRGLLPKGLTDLELSSDDEIDAASQEPQSKSKGLVGSLHNSEGEHGGAAVEKEPCTANVIENDPSPDCSLPGISQEMWQKFKELQKKKDELKTTKLYRKGKRQRKKKKVNKPGTESMESNQKREHQVEHEKHWGGLKQYFGINDRFQPPASGDLTPQSGLEKSIESAIAGGDFAKAEEMSDRLATRELAVKIAKAADCRDFVQSKQEAEASRAAQKRKKQIAWGFEAKQRWETKSNMGYM